jgi:hypothetical protein
MPATATVLDDLDQTITPERLERISARIGADPQRTKTAIDDALPLLLGALSAEASDPETAPGLRRALAEDHDGSLIDELDQFLGGSVSGRRADGAGILKHTLGARQAAAEEAIAERSGLDLSAIGPLLQMLAPIVLGMLGRKGREQGGGGFGLDDLLGSVLGGGTGATSGGRTTQSASLDDLLSSMRGRARTGAGSGRVDDSWKDRFRTRRSG